MIPVQPSYMDVQILAEFLQINKISNEDDDIVHARDGLEHVPTECPVKTDILNTLELLQKFS